MPKQTNVQEDIMARVKITVSFTSVGSSTPSSFRELEGTTLEEFLLNAAVTPTKVTTYLNGDIIEPGRMSDYELEDGDEVKCEAKNYASGC